MPKHFLISSTFHHFLNPLFVLSTLSFSLQTFSTSSQPSPHSFNPLLMLSTLSSSSQPSPRPLNPLLIIPIFLQYFIKLFRPLYLPIFSNPAFFTSSLSSQSPTSPSSPHFTSSYLIHPTLYPPSPPPISLLPL